MHRITALTLLVPASLALVHCSSPTSTPDPTARSGQGVHASRYGAGSTSTPAAQRAEEEVRQADAAEVQAFLDDDVPALGRLWSDEFIVTNPFNQVLRKAQVVGLVSSGALAFSDYARQIDYVQAYGDVVVVVGSETVVWAGHMPLTGQTSHLRYTPIWARQGTEWQEVARHASMVLPGGPGGPGGQAP